jgi:transcription antitermination factor NusG
MSWAILELTHTGERESSDTIRSEIHRVLRLTPEIFTPYMTNDQGLDLTLAHGYVFVKMDDLPKEKLFKLSNTKFVKSVMLEGSRGQRTPSVVDDAYIDSLRIKLGNLTTNDFAINDLVQIRSGTYRGMTGIVLNIYDDLIAITIELKSINFIIDCPKYNIEKL